MQCCVFTRFVYDVPYLDSFIEHYLNLGFDKIFILQKINIQNLHILKYFFNISLFYIY